MKLKILVAHLNCDNIAKEPIKAKEKTKPPSNNGGTFLVGAEGGI